MVKKIHSLNQYLERHPPNGFCIMYDKRDVGMLVLSSKMIHLIMRKVNI